jgi:hypothetical protein
LATEATYRSRSAESSAIGRPSGATVGQALEIVA